MNNEDFWLIWCSSVCLCLSLWINVTHPQLLVKVFLLVLSTETRALCTSHLDVKSVGVKGELFWRSFSHV